MAKQADGPAAPDRSTSASIYEACRRGVLERQLPLLRAHYAHKRDVMEAGAAPRARRSAVSWPKPKGGFFLWVTLPAAGSTPTR